MNAPETNPPSDPAGHVVVIAGPTASGKSALALALAEAFSGTVINGDSMQVYGDLPILTACPSAAETARVPHRLYGVLDGARACSAADWRAMAIPAIAEAWAAGRLPIIVGGTGLYLRALIDGLSPIPDIPEAVRAAVRARFTAIGNAAFHAELAARDPLMGGRLRVSDSQRLMRAAEVVEATGRSLADWQDEPADGPALGAAYLPIVLIPPRPVLRARCDARLDAMMAAGALDEARALMARGLDPALPVMKALGVPELLAHLSGQATLDDAVTAAKTATRRYAKRQCTWFRHQLPGAEVMEAQYSESLHEKIFPIVRRFLLTPWDRESMFP